MTEPDGYAVCIEDKKSSPVGFWIVNAYLTKDAAELIAKKTGGGKIRVLPFKWCDEDDNV